MGTPPDASAVESLFVVAASLARSLGLERVPFGVATAGLQGGGYRIAWLPVAEGPGQAARAFDLLARAASDPLAPFSDVVRWVARFARAGSTVVVVTGRDPTTYVADLHRLERSGCQTLVLACGPDGSQSRPCTCRRTRREERPPRRAVADGGPPRDRPVTP